MGELGPSPTAVPVVLVVGESGLFWGQLLPRGRCTQKWSAHEVQGSILQGWNLCQSGGVNPPSAPSLLFWLQAPHHRQQFLGLLAHPIALWPPLPRLQPLGSAAPHLHHLNPSYCTEQ